MQHIKLIFLCIFFYIKKKLFYHSLNFKVFMLYTYMFYTINIYTILYYIYTIFILLYTINIYFILHIKLFNLKNFKYNYCKNCRVGITGNNVYLFQDNRKYLCLRQLFQFERFILR